MNKKNLFIMLFILIGMMAKKSYSQGDSLNIGTVSGLLKDSVHNYVLESATVSVYSATDGKLVAYQLSNNFGRFSIKKLPVGRKLKLVATSVGYQTVERLFNLDKDQLEIKLGTINIEKVDVTLNEVAVTAKPPMQMKGDTLEFNADAFSLDTNAVVEDLLRKLPGVTIWRDGVITVNGKKITRLLVGGKDFFGGNASLALQNLPKNAIDKVQIYENKEDKDPINPPVEMNLILKKESSRGYFGKLGMGYGTDERYAADGMMSAYSQKLQLSVVGAANNVNKIAGDINALMRFNSFKGEQIDNDFHSDFLRPGENKFRSIGVKSDYEFTKVQRLKADFLYDDIDNETIQDSKSLFTLADGLQLNQSFKEESSSSNLGRRFNSGLYIKKDNHDFSARYDVRSRDTHRKLSQVTESQNEMSNQSNSSATEMDDSNSNHEIGADLSLHTRRYEIVGTGKRKSLNFDFDYSIHSNKGNDQSRRITNFESDDVSTNAYFNRKYQTNWKSTDHRITTGLKDILSLLGNEPASFSLDLSSSLHASNREELIDVRDLQDGTNQSVNNPYLSNDNEYRFIDVRPGIQLSKSYTYSLTNRYLKLLKIGISTEGQFIKQQNNSNFSYRNITRDYRYFVPSATLMFNNNQFGYFEKNYNLNYTTSIQLPTINELAPIIDDANVLFQGFGNIALKPAYNHELLLSYYYNNAAAKHPFNGSLSVRGNITEKFISDSIYYDEQGLGSRYPVNVSNRKSITAYSSLQKAFKIFNNQFQASLDASLAISRTPLYIGGEPYITESTGKSASIEMKYTYKSILNATIGQRLLTNNVRQISLNTYQFTNWTTDMGFSLALPRSIFFSTKIDFNRNVSSNIAPINYTIWNIDVGYRFLKGNNAEIKFSGLDLLRQNRSISNIVSSNSFTSRRVNVLQQYFTVGLAYYPRRFNSKQK